MPDFGSVLFDRPIARESTGTRDVEDGRTSPGVRIPIQRGDPLLRAGVRRQIGQMHIVVAARQQRSRGSVRRGPARRG